MSEVPAVKTPAGPLDVAAAVRAAWPVVFAGAVPSFDCVCLTCGHSALETDFWHEMFNWNLGNAKGVGPTGDFCEYPCGEDLDAADAKKYVAADPAHASFAPGQDIDTQAVIAVNFTPPHPMCKFKSYPDLASAMAAHLTMLRDEFSRCLAPLNAGDARAFAAALKAQRYFTAPLGPYATGVARDTAIVRAALEAAGQPASQDPAIPGDVGLEVEDEIVNGDGEPPEAA